MYVTSGYTHWLARVLRSVTGLAHARGSVVTHLSARILSVCLSIGLFVCPFVYLSACPFVCLSICLSICLPVHLSVCLSVCLPVCLSVCWLICVFVCVCLSIYLSVCLSVCHISVGPSMKQFSEELVPEGYVHLVIEHFGKQGTKAEYFLLHMSQQSANPEVNCNASMFMSY